MIVTRRCDAAGLNASEWAKFAASWVAWAGWPVCVTCDRGVRNRGMFAQVLSAHGVAEEMEQEELNQFVLPGMTDAEQLRKKEWLQIPRQARQALRRLHHMLGHKPKAVMRQVLKAGGAPPERKHQQGTRLLMKF